MIKVGVNRDRLWALQAQETTSSSHRSPLETLRRLACPLAVSKYPQALVLHISRSTRANKSELIFRRLDQSSRPWLCTLRKPHRQTERVAVAPQVAPASNRISSRCLVLCRARAGKYLRRRSPPLRLSSSKSATSNP